MFRTYDLVMLSLLLFEANRSCMARRWFAVRLVTTKFPGLLNPSPAPYKAPVPAVTGSSKKGFPGFKSGKSTILPEYKTSLSTPSVSTLSTANHIQAAVVNSLVNSSELMNLSSSMDDFPPHFAAVKTYTKACPAEPKSCRCLVTPPCTTPCECTTCSRTTECSRTTTCTTTTTCRTTLRPPCCADEICRFTLPPTQPRRKFAIGIHGSRSGCAPECCCHPGGGRPLNPEYQITRMPPKDRIYQKALSGELAERIVDTIFKRSAKRGNPIINPVTTKEQLKSLSKILLSSTMEREGCCFKLSGELKCFLAFLLLQRPTRRKRSCGCMGPNENFHSFKVDGTRMLSAAIHINLDAVQLPLSLYGFQPPPLLNLP